ncbi:MAG: maleylpyruvate isomerase N-terminal domain-containing protein [Actinomycetota bacterium]
MDLDRLIAEEGAGWTRLSEVLASIPPGRLEEPTVTTEGWSPKDVMFHVGFWMGDCADVLERIAAGDWGGGADETPATIEAANREGFRRSHAMVLDEVRDGFRRARERMLTAFRALEEVTPDAWEWFEESGPLHYAKHVEDLRAWLGR